MPKTITLEKALPYILIIGGIIGIAASFVLSYDKLQILKNPGFQPNCNLNPVISCGSVMKSSQGDAFGFPNPWIGLASFASIITVGASLLAGGKFKRWFWLALETGVIAGLAFALWLLYESVYRIQALCPYCLSVDVALLAIFWYLSLYLIQIKAIALPAKLRRPAEFVRRHHLDLLLVIFIIFIAVILKHFWYYYGRHL